jgi:hypothetical protein
MSRRKRGHGRNTNDNRSEQEKVLEPEYSTATAVGVQPDGGGRSSVADLILMRNTRILQGEAVPQQPGATGKPVIEVANTSAERAMKRSEETRKEIWRVAEANRLHYNNLQEADMPKQQKPWFTYLKQRFQYAEFIMIDPDMAAALLQSQELEDGTKSNRKIKPWLLEEYKRDLANGRWIPTDEGIGINLSQCLFNGQHRLTAIVETGISQPLWLTFNVLDEAKFVIDSGAKRTTAEKLQMVVNTKLGNRTAGMVKALMRGMATKMTFSDTEIAEFATKWEDTIEWVRVNAPKLRAEVQAAIAKAYLWYGEDAIKPFCTRITTIQFDGEGDPAKALFVALQRAKINRMNTAGVAYCKALSAIDAELDGRTLQKLQGAKRDQDIFLWQPGWELPEGAKHSA